MRIGARRVVVRVYRTTGAMQLGVRESSRVILLRVLRLALAERGIRGGVVGLLRLLLLLLLKGGRWRLRVILRIV